MHKLKGQSVLYPVNLLFLILLDLTSFLANFYKNYVLERFILLNFIKKIRKKENIILIFTFYYYYLENILSLSIKIILINRFIFCFKSENT
jgi:hypothetical protein